MTRRPLSPELPASRKDFIECALKFAKDANNFSVVKISPPRKPSGLSKNIVIVKIVRVEGSFWFNYESK